MQLSARGAQKKRNESKKLSMYSKQWLPGDTLRVFYPLFWVDDRPEIAVGAVWGHNVSDIKGLGLKTAFIPSTTDFDENGIPIGQPDITYQFSLIAKAFVNGQKAKEEKELANKPWPSESSYKEALKTLEAKYDTKNNMSAVKPIISRAQYYVSTEVVSVKIANNAPIKETIMVTSAPLSNQTINRLYAILDDPKYPIEKGAQFLEVEWKYPVNAEKAKSAKDAAPAGLTPEYRFEVQYAESWNAVQDALNTVSRDAVSIARRATRAVDPARVRQALTQYAFMNSQYLDAVAEEDAEVLTKHADLVKELDLVRTLTNADLIGKIQTAINDLAVARPNVAPILPTPVSAPETSTVPEASPLNPAPAPVAPAQAAPAPSIPLTNAPEGIPVPAPETPVAPIVAGAPNIQSLLNNQNNVGANTDADLLDADFTTSV